MLLLVCVRSLYTCSSCRYYCLLPCATPRPDISAHPPRIETAAGGRPSAWVWGTGNAWQRRVFVSIDVSLSLYLPFARAPPHRPSRLRCYTYLLAYRFIRSSGRGPSRAFVSARPPNLAAVGGVGQWEDQTGPARPTASCADARLQDGRTGGEGIPEVAPNEAPSWPAVHVSPLLHSWCTRVLLAGDGGGGGCSGTGLAGAYLHLALAARSHDGGGRAAGRRPVLDRLGSRLCSARGW